jgi:fatty acid synthase subunit alpha
MFVGMVLPGDQLNVKIRHIGMRDGNMAVKIETSTIAVRRFSMEPRKLLTTVYVTGQIEPGMGMDLYNSSSMGRRRCSPRRLRLFVEIVKDNPKEKTSLRRHQGPGHSSTVHGHDIRHNGQGRKC